MLDLITNSELNNFTSKPVDKLYNTQNKSDQDFIEALLRVDSIQGLYNLCSQIRYHYGFDSFSIFARFNRVKQKPLCLMMREFDNDWSRHYQKSNYALVDPGIRVAITTNTPFSWHITEYNKIISPMNSIERKIALEGVEFGLRNIFNVPFHSKTNNFGLIRFINDQSGQDHRIESLQRINKNSELFLLGGFIYQAIENIVTNSIICNQLTKREQDILSWVAHGLNPAHISDKLTISEHTVRNHLRNIRSKLQVKTMPHAVARAVSTGLIYL